jgi:hypothetical protein
VLAGPAIRSWSFAAKYRYECSKARADSCTDVNAKGRPDPQESAPRGTLARGRSALGSSKKWPIHSGQRDYYGDFTTSSSSSQSESFGAVFA